jgi:two-component system, NtrC family, response regulator AtoC
MNIMVIESDSLFSEAVQNFLSIQLGHNCQVCGSIEAALEVLPADMPDLIISELMMPGLDSFDLMDHLKELCFNGMLIVLCAESDAEAQVKALEYGADEVLTKPLALELLATKIKHLAEVLKDKRELSLLKQDFEGALQTRLEAVKKELATLQSEYRQELGIRGMGVYCEAMRQITSLCMRIHQDRDLPVLITGETGTGKELIARLIHFGDQAEKRPFITLNCSAIPPTLFESELFGYERGAFTGSNREGKIGKLEMANGGTLLLDEIGDLPLDMQPKLLRVIQEREMYRVGGTKSIALDIRFLFATHHDLQALVADQRFRSDLFYRISTVFIKIPPLRERRDEIIPLAQLFLKQISAKKHQPLKFLTNETARLLREYSWPGNVRELQGAMERAYLISEEIEIAPDYFSFLLPNSPLNFDVLGKRQLFVDFPPADFSLHQAITSIIRKALALHNNNKSQAARYLGISVNRLKRYLNP